MTTLAEIQRHVGVPADGKWGPRTASAVAKALGMNGKPPIMADPGAFFSVTPKITGTLNQVQVDTVNELLASAAHRQTSWLDRKSVVRGKSVSVSVERVGSRIIIQKQIYNA